MTTVYQECDEQQCTTTHGVLREFLAVKLIEAPVQANDHGVSSRRGGASAAAFDGERQQRRGACFPIGLSDRTSIRMSRTETPEADAERWLGRMQNGLPSFSGFEARGCISGLELRGVCFGRRAGFNVAGV